MVAYRWTYAPDRMAWAPMSAPAVQAIRQCQAPIYNGYNEGGVLIWFVPDQPVFIDSRQDPIRWRSFRPTHRPERSGDYAPLFARYGIHCAVFHAGSEGPPRLAAHGWHERFRDGQWVVLDPP